MKVKNTNGNEMCRGDIFWCCPRNTTGKYTRRMYVVVSNDQACIHSHSIVMCPLTTKHKKDLPTHVIAQNINGRDATIKCEDTVTIDKIDIMDYVCSLTSIEMKKLNHALAIAVGL